MMRRFGETLRSLFEPGDPAPGRHLRRGAPGGGRAPAISLAALDAGGFERAGYIERAEDAGGHGMSSVAEINACHSSESACGSRSCPRWPPHTIAPLSPCPAHTPPSHRQCVHIGHHRCAQRARAPDHTDPIRRLAPLPFRVRDVDIIAKTNHVLEAELLEQVLEHRSIPESAVCHHRHLRPLPASPRAARATTPTQTCADSPSTPAPAPSSTSAASPVHGPSTSTARSSRDHRAREARPTRCHDNLNARTDHVRHPIAQGISPPRCLVVQQPADPLDSVLARLAHRPGNL